MATEELMWHEFWRPVAPKREQAEELEKLAIKAEQAGMPAQEFRAKLKEARLAEDALCPNHWTGSLSGICPDCGKS